MANLNSQDIFRQTRHPKEVNDYYHVFNKSNALNVVYWKFFIDLINNIDGDIVECGVGRGRSLISILSLLEMKRMEDLDKLRSVYALDSFSGFPEPCEFDKSSRDPKRGEWSSSPNGMFDYSPDNLIKILKLADISVSQLKDLKIIPGYFNETIKTIDSKQIALLHLDGDLYDSIKFPLTTLSERISVGGVIVVDDYILDTEGTHEDAFPGARKAVNEFLDEVRNFSIKKSMRGTPYLIKEYK
jgi:O-methyltransferase